MWHECVHLYNMRVLRGQCRAWQGPYRWSSTKIILWGWECSHRWKLRGGKKKKLLIFILHIPVCPQPEISHSSPWKRKSSQQCNHREELLHSCTWNIEFGQWYAPSKSHLYILLCFSGDNAYWKCPSMVTLHLQLLGEPVSLETLLLFRRMFVRRSQCHIY